MPDYLWSGKDKSGKSFTERVTAATATQARTLLEERDCTDLKLHSDDIMAATREQFDQHIETTPREQLKYQSQGGATLLGTWVQAIKQSKGTMLLLVGLCAWSVYREKYWMAATWVGFILAFPAIYLWFTQATRYYAQLNKARVWHRWEEVLNCLKKLERAKRWTKISIPDAEFVRCQAMALAGLGRFEAALAEIAANDNNPKVPRWLYLSQLASLHAIAKKHQEAITLSRQALELKAGDPAFLIDLANRIVRRQKNTIEARTLLTQAEQQALTEIAKPHASLCRGLIAYYERDYPTAKAKFQETLTRLQPLLVHPLVEGTYLETKAFLCCAEGAMGNLTEARRLFDETQNFLKAIDEDDLLTECRNAAHVS